MDSLLRPLFDVQRVYTDGKAFHYELYYKSGTSYVKIVDACFLTWRGAQDQIDELVNGEV